MLAVSGKHLFSHVWRFACPAFWLETRQSDGQEHVRSTRLRFRWMIRQGERDRERNRWPSKVLASGGSHRHLHRRMTKNGRRGDEISGSHWVPGRFPWVRSISAVIYLFSYSILALFQVFAWPFATWMPRSPNTSSEPTALRRLGTLG